MTEDRDTVSRDLLRSVMQPGVKYSAETLAHMLRFDISDVDATNKAQSSVPHLVLKKDGDLTDISQIGRRLMVIVTLEGMIASDLAAKCWRDGEVVYWLTEVTKTRYKCTDPVTPDAYSRPAPTVTGLTAQLVYHLFSTDVGMTLDKAIVMLQKCFVPDLNEKYLKELEKKPNKSNGIRKAAKKQTGAVLDRCAWLWAIGKVLRPLYASGMLVRRPAAQRIYRSKREKK